MNIMKIKVLIVINNFGVGGAEHVALQTLLGFQNHPEFEFCAATWDARQDSPYDQIIQKKHLNVHYLEVKEIESGSPLRRKWKNYRLKYRALENVIREFQPDVIHVQMSHNVKYVCQLAHYYHIPGRCVALHANPDMVKNSDALFMRLACNLFHFQALCLNESQAHKAVHRYHLKRYSIVHNGMDFGKLENNRAEKTVLRRENNIPEEVLVIGFVGRLHAVKNLDFSLKIMQKLKEEKKQFCFMIVGDGEERQHLEELTGKMGLKEHVMFLGNRDDAAKLYYCMDVFLLNSVSEAHPLVLMEAQACGIRCVISDGVPADAVFAENVSQLQLAQPVSEWAREIWEGGHFLTPANRKEDYTMEASRRQLMQVYRKLVFL